MSVYQNGELLRYIRELDPWFKARIETTRSSVTISVFYEGGPCPSDFDIGFRCALLWREVDNGKWRGIMESNMQKLKNMTSAP